MHVPWFRITSNREQKFVELSASAVPMSKSTTNLLEALLLLLLAVLFLRHYAQVVLLSATTPSLPKGAEEE
jgi:hypothetical protein